MRVRITILVLTLALLAAGRPAAAVPPMAPWPSACTSPSSPAGSIPARPKALITPFMVLYSDPRCPGEAHAGRASYTPSLAESWTLAKDGVTYEFVLRKNAKFHNGDPVTAEDVKFTFERYRGSGAKLLKDEVKEVQIAAPNRVRIVLKEPWPDFMAFYGTSATGAELDRAEEVHREGRRGRVQEGPDGRGAVQVRVVQSRRGAGARGLPRVLAEGAPGEAPRHALHPRREHARRRGEDGRGGHRLPLRGRAGRGAARARPASRSSAPLLYGVYWLDFLDQWDPKSPWHDRRVRLAASHAIDRQAINQVEMLGPRQGHRLLRAAGVRVRAEDRRPAYDPEARQAAPGRGRATRTASKRAISRRCRPTPHSARRWRAISRRSGSGAACAPWSAPPSWPPGARRSSTGSSSAPPAPPATPPRGWSPSSPRPASTPTACCREIDDLFRSRRRSWTERSARRCSTRSSRSSPISVLAAPIFQQAFIWRRGPRVAETGAGLIQGFPYSAPGEDLRLK